MARLAHGPLLESLSLAALTPLALSQTPPRLVEIGAVTPNSINLTLYSVQSHGRSVFSQFRLSPELEISVWDHADGVSVIPLGTGPAIASLGDASDSGDVIVYAFHPTGSTNQDLWRGIRLDGTGGQEILQAPAGGSGATSARWISGDGTTVAGSYRLTPSLVSACRWDGQGTPEALGDLPGGTVDGYCTGVSDDGSLITGQNHTGVACDPGGCYDVYSGFWWTAATGMQPMEVLAPGLVGGVPSGDGSAIVGSRQHPVTQEFQPVRYRFGQGIEVLAPSGDAYLTNRDGTVIAGEITGGSLPGHPSYTGAFVWLEGQGAFALVDVLANAGVVLPPGIQVHRISGMSPEGDALLLRAGPPSGADREYVAFLGAPSLPIGSSECAPAALNSTGSAGVLTAEGFGFAGGPGFVLRASGLPTGSTCMFLASRSAGFTVMPGGSQGNLCLAGSIGRFFAPSEVQTTDAAGRAALSVDPTFVAQPTGRVTIAAGETWRFQAWYRDANPGATSNFTDGLAETFE